MGTTAICCEKEKPKTAGRSLGGAGKGMAVIQKGMGREFEGGAHTSGQEDVV